MARPTPNRVKVFGGVAAAFALVLVMILGDVKRRELAATQSIADVKKLAFHSGPFDIGKETNVFDSLDTSPHVWRKYKPSDTNIFEGGKRHVWGKYKPSSNVFSEWIPVPWPGEGAASPGHEWKPYTPDANVISFRNNWRTEWKGPGKEFNVMDNGKDVKYEWSGSKTPEQGVNVLDGYEWPKY